MSILGELWISLARQRIQSKATPGYGDTASAQASGGFDSITPANGSAFQIPQKRPRQVRPPTAGQGTPRHSTSATRRHSPSERHVLLATITVGPLATVLDEIRSPCPRAKAHPCPALTKTSRTRPRRHTTSSYRPHHYWLVLRTNADEARFLFFVFLFSPFRSFF